MADPIRRTPLHRMRARLEAAREAPGAIRLAEVPWLTQLTLRLAPGGDAASAAAAVLGTRLPAPGAAHSSAEIDVLWLGPDEWLVVAGDGEGDRVAQRLAAAVADAHASIVDLSAQRTVIELAGAAARDVLAKGCRLDLHPRAFAAGSCASTELARAGVILHQRSDEPLYRVFVRATFAEYLAEWLLDASAEYRGVPPLDLRFATIAELERPTLAS
ncbi:sarcosine oxidase subunit gamma [Capillimicrobium parvum]|uniref:Sarcosine oxidase subunit gamma n=1 Tax=Capillimicrobium parvum TaxID=2884022 RepID=A0A9E7C148_9ACTN|nr:sarcosine oxidase subunit gamma family protein [Capillimicrobium parvum]UGS37051.1 Sarcosine oxidase subunit gamma [Capillimicrobium parvum]